MDKGFDMTIRHMKTFVEVYRNGNMTRAAEKLHMAQPAVSRMVQELEKYYGVRMFERMGRKISATEAGKHFYAYALHIIDSFEQMEEGMRNWDEQGIVRVGASVTLGSMLLPKVLKEYRLRHGGITVRTTVTNGTRLQGMLENNELDFALIEGSITSDALVAEELTEDRLILLLPTDSELLSRGELRLSDLQGYPLLLREKESVSRILLDHVYALKGLSQNVLMESVSVHAIVEGVHEGLGLSFLPERLVRRSLMDGYIATRPLEDEDFARKNYVVRHKNKLLGSSAQELLELCRQLAESPEEEP